MKRRRFADRTLARIYNAYVEAWLDGPTGVRTELFMEDGSTRSRGSLGRVTFWRAFNGISRSPRERSRGTLLSAVYAAGLDCGREARRKP